MEAGMAKSSRKYTPEFKQRAVLLWRESGTTYAEVARGLGIDESLSSLLFAK